MNYDEYQQYLQQQAEGSHPHPEREPGGFLGSALDFLSRGQYFSAKFFDTLASDGLGAFGDALLAGAVEAVNPVERLGFEDVMERVAPDMNPIAKSLLGTVGNLVIDPLNALSFGSFGAEKLFGRALSKVGLKARTAIEIGDSLRALGTDTEKLGRIAAMGKEAKTPAAREFLQYIFKDKAASIDRDALQKILTPQSLEPPVAITDDAIAKITGSANPAETIAADYGQEAAQRFNDYHSDLIGTLDAKSKDLYSLAERIRSGEASLDETKFAWDFVKHNADDPDALLKLQQVFPDQAEKALKFDELKQEARRLQEDSVNKRMAEAVGMEVTVDPNTGRMRLPQGAKPTQNLDYFDKGGVKLFGQTVIPGEVFHVLGNVTGLNKLLDKGKDLKFIQGIAGIFNRNFKLPWEYLRHRQDYETSQLQIAGKLMDNLQNIFGGLKKEQRLKIGEVSAKIHDASVLAGREQTEAKIAQMTQELGRPLTEAEAKNAVVKLSPEQADAIRQKIVEESGLINDKEAYASFVKLRHAYNEMGMAQVQGGLMEELATNYHPLIHDFVKDWDTFKAWKSTGPSSFLPAGMERKYTFEEAIKDGYRPEMDALTLYAQRFIESKKALASHYFQEAVKHTFGVEGISKLPARMQKDIQFVGDSSYAGLGESAREALKLYDYAIGKFKTFATVAKPSFGIRQFVSNGLQSYLTQGLKRSHLWDPRSALDAMSVILHKNGLLSDAARFAEMKLETAFDKVYSGPELAALLDEFGVLRGTNISGGIYSKNSAKELAKHFKGNSPSMSGLRKIASGILHYTNWPSHVEDLARTHTFMNGLRMGLSPRKAAEMVNVALFDYANGLSRAGKVFGTRMMPFFSFTNFMIPLIGNIMITHPSRIANVNKVAQGFLSAMNKVYGGEELTDSERKVLPGYLLEQPNFLQKFDEQGQAVYKTFNNFSPLDVMGSLQLDERGNTDWKATIQKLGLAQLSPFIKYPLELLVGKSFFTGQDIGGMNAGKIGVADPNQFISNLAGLVIGANQGNIVAGLVGKGVSDVALSPEFIQDGIKKLIGWEGPITDPRTGKQTVYINPYMFHAISTVIPSLGSVVRLQRPELKPEEKMADFLLGVGTQKQNLRFNLQRKRQEQRYAIEDQRNLVRRALRANRPDRAQQEQDKLKELLIEIARWREGIDPGDIR